MAGHPRLGNAARSRCGHLGPRPRVLAMPFDFEHGTQWRLRAVNHCGAGPNVSCVGRTLSRPHHCGLPSTLLSIDAVARLTDTTPVQAKMMMAPGARATGGNHDE